MVALIKQPFTEQVYQLLRNEILNQSIACGQKLNISELQKNLNVSGSPVREAISRLHQEGLVEYIPNVGAKVIEFKEKDIIELQDIHSLLDCSALKLAMLQEKNSVIAAELFKCIDLQQKGSYTEKQYASSQFHKVFYLFAHNGRLLTIWQQVDGQIGILRTMYTIQFPKMENEDVGLQEHIKIYEAILQGDTEKATMAIEEHHRNATKVLLRIVK
jgi:DNA-binding GntR family transcriptional regulator